MHLGYYKSLTSWTTESLMQFPLKIMLHLSNVEVPTPQVPKSLSPGVNFPLNPSRISTTQCCVKAAYRHAIHDTSYPIFFSSLIRPNPQTRVFHDLSSAQPYVVDVTCMPLLAVVRRIYFWSSYNTITDSMAQQNLSQ